MNCGSNLRFKVVYEFDIERFTTTAQNGIPYGTIKFEQILGDNYESGLVYMWEQDWNGDFVFVDGDYTAQDFMVNLLAGKASTLPI